MTITKTKWDNVALYQYAGIIHLTKDCQNDYAENPKLLGGGGQYVVKDISKQDPN